MLIGFLISYYSLTGVVIDFKFNVHYEIITYIFGISLNYTGTEFVEILNLYQISRFCMLFLLNTTRNLLN